MMDINQRRTAILRTLLKSVSDETRARIIESAGDDMGRLAELVFDELDKTLEHESGDAQ